MAKLKVPDKTCTGISLGAKFYEAKDGVVDIPEHNVDAALSHGFVLLKDSSENIDEQPVDTLYEIHEHTETEETDNSKKNRKKLF